LCHQNLVLKRPAPDGRGGAKVYIAQGLAKRNPYGLVNLPDLRARFSQLSPNNTLQGRVSKNDLVRWALRRLTRPTSRPCDDEIVSGTTFEWRRVEIEPSNLDGLPRRPRSSVHLDPRVRLMVQTNGEYTG
jgi:hypothetical protein